MDHGKMLLQGKVDDLLRDHANFYPLEVDISSLPKDKVDELKEKIQELYPDCEHGDTDSDKKLTYKIPTKSTVLPDVLEKTEQLKAQFKVELILQSPNIHEVFMTATTMKDSKSPESEAV